VVATMTLMMAMMALSDSLFIINYELFNNNKKITIYIKLVILFLLLNNPLLLIISTISC
jgi:hypothetical protein